jgi:hypothetical protein
VDVVGVHDPGAGAAHGRADLFRPQPAAQQADRGVARRDLGRAALEHLDLLAKVLADQPLQILHRPLLPARMAVAVVQQQDHGLQG